MAAVTGPGEILGDGKLTARAYQIEMYEKSLESNIIVVVRIPIYASAEIWLLMCPNR
jgi:hypothetical protein